MTVYTSAFSFVEKLRRNSNGFLDTDGFITAVDTFYLCLGVAACETGS